jgi:hypothetical protein
MRSVCRRPSTRERSGPTLSAPSSNRSVGGLTLLSLLSLLSRGSTSPPTRVLTSIPSLLPSLSAMQLDAVADVIDTLQHRYREEYRSQNLASVAVAIAFPLVRE